MIKAIYLQVLEIFKKIPVKLWGISLLAGVISLIITVIGVNLPIITIPVTAALSAGMCAVYYAAYRNGGEGDTNTLFAVFKDWKTFKRIAGGMCWMYLWLFLWALIPIAGVFIAVYKSLQYAFTPFILTHEPTVSGRQALKKSMEDTKGYKLNMFLAIVLPSVAFGIASLILSALGFIPFAGVVFIVINALVTIVWTLVAPLFFGLVGAGFYDYGKKPFYTAPVSVSIPAAPSAPAAETAPAAGAPAVNPAEKVTAPPAAIVCPTCGTENNSDKKFCKKCGAKL